MKSTTIKIIGTIAVVGTVAAAVALFGNNASSHETTRFLAQSDDNNGQVLKAFQDFVSKHNKNYLTKDEFNARF